MNAHQDALDRRAAQTAARHRAQARSLREILGGREVLPRPEQAVRFDENGPSEFDDPLRHGGRSSDDAGGALVPVGPRAPRPIPSGGAARTFAEMDEPPRDP